MTQPVDLDALEERLGLHPHDAAYEIIVAPHMDALITELRAAREVVAWAREARDLARLDYPAPSWFGMLDAMVAKYDRLVEA